MNTNIERGSASLFISLTGGKIKVFHGTDKTLLFKRSAKVGDWDKIIKQLREGN